MSDNQNSGDDQVEQSATGGDQAETKDHSGGQSNDNDQRGADGQSGSPGDKSSREGGSASESSVGNDNHRRTDRRSGGFSGHSDNHDRGRSQHSDRNENEHATEYGIGLAGSEPVPDEVGNFAHNLSNPAAHDHVLTDGRTRPLIVAGLIMVAIVVLAIAAIGLFTALSTSGPVEFCPGDELADRVDDGSTDTNCEQPPTPG